MTERNEHNSNDEFYVGYLPQMPSSFGRRVRQVIIVLAILIPIFGFLAAFYQNNYSNGRYDLGKLTTVQGIVSKTPVPNIKVLNGTTVNGKPIYQTIPLVSFGKFGATGLVDAFEQRVQNEKQKALHEVMLTLEGTLAYNDGKALMELTKKEKALIEIANPPSGFVAPNLTAQVIGRTAASLRGEIVDPKCYFGAMNPAKSKSHKSCAIMCISGGIPPVFVVESEAGSKGYYFLLGTEGEAINKDILDYIADPVEITGQVQQFDDWHALLIDPAKGIVRL